jgi:hypothetical protein
MPATSKSQQRTAGAALSCKRSGDCSKAPAAVKSMAKMPTSTLMEYAKTKHGNLPERVSKK